MIKRQKLILGMDEINKALSEGCKMVPGGLMVCAMPDMNTVLTYMLVEYEVEKK